MAKFYGTVGYTETVETTEGVWEPQDTERQYTGDVLRMTRRYEPGESTNDNLNVNNRLSIVADPYALQHFHAIKWVEWHGAKWKVTDVEVEYPRLILSIGGVYNG